MADATARRHDLPVPLISRWARRPVRPPTLWFGLAAVAAVCGIAFVTIPLNLGIVPRLLTIGLVAVLGVGLGINRGLYERSRIAAGMRIGDKPPRAPMSRALFSRLLDTLPRGGRGLAGHRERVV